MRRLFLIACVIMGCETKKPEPAAPEPKPTTPPVSRRELLATDDPGGASAVDKELRERIAAAKLNPKKSDAWILVGRSWIQKARNDGDPGFYLNADAAAEMALELEPKNYLAIDLRGMVLLNSHRFAEAKQLANSIIEMRPDDPTAYGILSDAELELGDIPAAAAAADKMCELKPDLPSYSRVSYLRWLIGDPKGAIEAMRLAFDAGRGQTDKEPAAWALNESAMYFWHLGDVEGASAGFDLVLQYAKDYAPAMVGRARVAMARGKPEAAVALLESALKAQPLPETAWLLADAKTMMGDTAGAEKAYAQLVDLAKRTDPRTLALYYASQKKEPELAIKLAKEELDKRPNLHSRDVYAFALLQAGKAAEAKAQFAPLLPVKIPEPMFKYHAALIAIANGETAQGKKMLKEIVEKTPGFDRAAAEEARRILKG